MFAQLPPRFGVEVVGNGTVDEHRIGVGEVADLPSAPAAHRDDPEFVVRSLWPVQVGSDRLQGTADRQVHEIGEIAGYLGPISDIEDVAQSDAQQLTAVGLTDRSDRVGPVATEQSVHLGVEDLQVTGLEVLIAIQPGDGRGLTQQKLRRVPGQGEHFGDRLRGQTGVPEHLEEPPGR